MCRFRRTNSLVRYKTAGVDLSFVLMKEYAVTGRGQRHALNCHHDYDLVSCYYVRKSLLAIGQTEKFELDPTVPNINQLLKRPYLQYFLMK